MKFQLSRVFALVCVCFCIFVSFAIVQQNILSDIVQWFPEGIYREISHVDFESMPIEVMEQKLDPKKLRNPRAGSFLFMPLSLRKGVFSVTRARLVKFHVFEKRDRNSNSQKSSDGHPQISVMSFHFKNKDYSISDSGSYLLVARHNDISNAIAKALRKEEIQKIDEKIHGLQIYTWKFEHINLGKHTFFGSATLTGEFVFSSEKEILHDMINTGMSGTFPALADDGLSKLRELFPDLGHYWYWDNVGAIINAINKWRIKHSDSEAEAERWSLPVEGTRLAHIYSSDYQKDGSSHSSTYVIFARAEDASQYYKRAKAKLARSKAIPATKIVSQASLRALGDSKTHVELFGDYVVTTKVIDQELIDMQQRFSEQLRKEKEEKKKQDP